MTTCPIFDSLISNVKVVFILLLTDICTWLEGQTWEVTTESTSYHPRFINSGEFIHVRRQILFHVFWEIWRSISLTFASRKAFVQLTNRYRILTWSQYVRKNVSNLLGTRLGHCVGMETKDNCNVLLCLQKSTQEAMWLLMLSTALAQNISFATLVKNHRFQSQCIVKHGAFIT